MVKNCLGGIVETVLEEADAEQWEKELREEKQREDCPAVSPLEVLFMGR